MAVRSFQLPIIDLSSSDRKSTASSIRQACMDYGFFYLINHGVEEDLLQRVFQESRKFFSLPLEEKMKLARREERGYSPLHAEKLDPSLSSKGDAKETMHIGPLDDETSHLNQWPPTGNYRSITVLEICNAEVPHRTLECWEKVGLFDGIGFEFR